MILQRKKSSVIRWGAILLLLVLIATVLSLDSAVSQAQGSFQSCGGYIWYGQQVSGRVPWAGADCRYTFSASYGDIITISMYRNGGYLVPALALLDSYGNQIAVDNNLYRYSRSSISNYRLSRSGSYTIVARSYNYSGSGPFRLSLSKRY